MSKPTESSTVLARVSARRPITEQRTVLPVLRRKTSNGHRWLLVRLPGRPNGRTGWIMRRATVSSGRAGTSWSSRPRGGWRSTSHGRRVRIFKAVVGKSSTPTPLGEFFVEESIKLPADAVGAPFALALSARSNVLPGVRRRPGPDRPARPEQRRRHARHRGLSRLRATEYRRDAMAGQAHRPRHSGNDHSVAAFRSRSRTLGAEWDSRPQAGRGERGAV